jgi:hypothetical protein
VHQVQASVVLVLLQCLGSPRLGLQWGAVHHPATRLAKQWAEVLEVAVVLEQAFQAPCLAQQRRPPTIPPHLTGAKPGCLIGRRCRCAVERSQPPGVRYGLGALRESLASGDRRQQQRSRLAAAGRPRLVVQGLVEGLLVEGLVEGHLQVVGAPPRTSGRKTAAVRPLSSEPVQCGTGLGRSCTSNECGSGCPVHASPI